MTSTILLWHSENCFETWSAHLLPQTDHDLGMKSCMTGMHGFNPIGSTIFGETLLRALFGNALEPGAIWCQSTFGLLAVPQFDVDVQGTSHC